MLSAEQRMFFISHHPYVAVHFDCNHSVFNIVRRATNVLHLPPAMMLQFIPNAIILFLILSAEQRMFYISHHPYVAVHSECNHSVFNIVRRATNVLHLPPAMMLQFIPNAIILFLILSAEQRMFFISHHPYVAVHSECNHSVFNIVRRATNVLHLPPAMMLQFIPNAIILFLILSAEQRMFFISHHPYVAVHSECNHSVFNIVRRATNVLHLPPPICCSSFRMQSFCF